MNKIIALIVVFPVSLLSVSGQTIMEDQLLAGQYITYQIKDEGGDTGNVLVSNVKNTLSKTRYLQPMFHGHAPDPNVLVIDKEVLSCMVAGAFSIPRLKELGEGEKSLYMRLYFDVKGVLKEVEFGVSEHSLLTAEELESMERKIVNNIQGKLKTREWDQGNYISFIILRFIEFHWSLSLALVWTKY